MPEGDTVHRSAARLNEALAGATVTRFDLRVPRYATADLTGETVHEVVAIGKHLVHHIGEWTLHTHLKMEGTWYVFAPGRRWPRPAYQARAIVATAAAESVGFELGVVELFRTADDAEHLGYLGPDPLSDSWDAALAISRLLTDTRPAQVALLEQRSIAGFGTVYANELMFLRGILPSRALRADEVPGLVDLGARALRQNLPRNRRTFTGDSRPGHNLWVYGRAGKPCRRCGTRVRQGQIGATATSERVSYWCPRCQT